MMSFEEEFPNLKNGLLCDNAFGDYIAYTRKDIKEYCLDKQRVREAIKKAKEQLDFKHDYHNSCESMGSIQFIEKELGLEDRK